MYPQVWKTVIDELHHGVQQADDVVATLTANAVSDQEGKSVPIVSKPRPRRKRRPSPREPVTAVSDDAELNALRINTVGKLGFKAGGFFIREVPSVSYNE